ncbi:MAG: 2-oxo acid dehydrogenase subunit E2 [Candidatus Sungbacteria bacterium]|nr:2-oxo acid dehydrogenase subunit E2 [Candidatus Sungbacteria bacterium]
MRFSIKRQIEKDIDVVCVIKWHKKVGDTLEKGERILHVESLKGDEDLDAPHAGVLAEINVQDNEEIMRPADHKVGSWDAIFGWIEAELKDQSEVRDRIEKEPMIAASPGQIEDFRKENINIIPVPHVVSPKSSAVKAGPYVRRIARELGADLAKITGSGPRGTITIEQVRKAVGKTNAPDFMEKSEPVQPEISSCYKDQPLDMTRRRIAENLQQSWDCIPHAGCSVRIDFRNILHVRAKLKRHLADHSDFAGLQKFLRLEAVVINGILLSLQGDGRILNSCFGCEHLGFEGVRMYDGVNLGIAYQHPSGLVVPVLQDVDGITYREICYRLHDLYTRALSGGLRPSDLKGGTFTFNNAGVLGADGGESIIVHGQSAICTFCRIEEEAGSPFYGFANLGLRFDHRIYDGAQALRFLTNVREFVEGVNYETKIRESTPFLT